MDGRLLNYNHTKSDLFFVCVCVYIEDIQTTRDYDTYIRQLWETGTQQASSTTHASTLAQLPQTS